MVIVNYFVNVFKISQSLVIGLIVTWKWFFKSAITVQYPDEKLQTAERFRGNLVFSKETCTACGMCVKACPSECIALEPAADAATKKRMAKAAWYEIDFAKCNYCGLCEEACPTKPLKSVRHGHNYEWSSVERKRMTIKWVNEKFLPLSSLSASSAKSNGEGTR